ncbi:MAG: class I SAM-dependent methyltransferase [Gaiellaceae bacterium]
MTSGRRRGRSLLTEISVRLLLATRLADAGYRIFERTRSELVAALAPDPVLVRFNDLAYGESGFYRPETTSFREYLFPWEEFVVRELFPSPPARILVGGAGGGREAFALLGLGFEVVAFEPSRQLAEFMATRAPEGASLQVYCGGYEDLPRLEPLEAAPAVELPDLGSFDAAVAGWGSFSHLRTEAVRVTTLEAFGHVTAGPILVSFLGLKDAPSPQHRSRLGRLRRWVPRRAGRELGDVFSAYIGFYHRTDEAEVRTQSRAAGLEVVHGQFDERDTNWPHVVLRRQDGGTAAR